MVNSSLRDLFAMCMAFLIGKVVSFDARERAYAPARAVAPRSRVPQNGPLFFCTQTRECVGVVGEGTERSKKVANFDSGISFEIHVYSLIIGNTCRGMHL